MFHSKTTTTLSSMVSRNTDGPVRQEVSMSPIQLFRSGTGLSLKVFFETIFIIRTFTDSDSLDTGVLTNFGNRSSF